MTFIASRKLANDMKSQAHGYTSMQCKLVLELLGFLLGGVLETSRFCSHWPVRYWLVRLRIVEDSTRLQLHLINDFFGELNPSKSNLPPRYSNDSSPSHRKQGGYVIVKYREEKRQARSVSKGLAMATPPGLMGTETGAVRNGVRNGVHNDIRDGGPSSSSI